MVYTFLKAIVPSFLPTRISNKFYYLKELISSHNFFYQDQNVFNYINFKCEPMNVIEMLNYINSIYSVLSVGSIYYLKNYLHIYVTIICIYKYILRTLIIQAIYPVSKS